MAVTVVCMVSVNTMALAVGYLVGWGQRAQDGDYLCAPLASFPTLLSTCVRCLAFGFNIHFVRLWLRLWPGACHQVPFLHYWF